MMTLDSFSGALRWVAWRNELRSQPPKPTKVPYSPTGRKAKANDPSTWGTRLAAEACAGRLVNGAGGGIGFQLGDLGNGMFVAGIDLDSCLAQDGALAPWASAILTAVPSYAERSPSGRGVKVFFCAAREVVRSFLDRIGVLIDQWGTRRGIPGEDDREHGPAIEIYFARRYFAVTGERWPGTPPDLLVLNTAQLDRLATLIPPRRSPEASGREAADKSRSARAFRKGLEMRHAGASFEEFCEALRTDSETASWYSEKGAAADEREVRRIWAKGESGPANDAIEIARLAALPPIEYGRERKPTASRLGCPVTILDKAVAAERSRSGSFSGQGRRLELYEPEPWPEPVNGAALLDRMAAAVRRHVVLGRAEADAVAVWVLALHAFDAWVIFPRLFISSPEKGCGKSTLLDVLSRLVPKPLGASNITAAALFRVIEAVRPTLLLDEADSYARDNEDLRGVLDAGHRRDGAVIRTVGDDHEPRQFSAWAPVALAAIGRLPGTIEDRSIRIGLRRRRPDEMVDPLRLDRTAGMEELTRMAARWAADYGGALAVVDPEMPPDIVNRAADNWRPLLAVADLSEGAWPERARCAALALSAAVDDESIRVALLADIKAAFAAKEIDRIASEELVSYLVGLDDRPWPDYRHGKPITKAQVARLLTPLVISSGTIRLGDGRTAKGYYRRAFDDAFARYLTPKNVTASQPQHSCGIGADSKTSHGMECDVSGSRGMPSKTVPCDGVTLSEGLCDDAFDERAAIREFDGGFARAEAEWLTRDEGNN